MPQMSPMSWLSLFFLFTLTYILINIMNYFIFLNSPASSSTLKLYNLTTYTWKW